MRRIAVALAVAAALAQCTGALAGDIAEMRPYGFSPDGRFFAFEEFGVQDGSGFPFATIYVIDTQTDTYVAGTPFKTLIKKEEASVGEARRESARQAQATLTDYAIGDDPGYLSVYAPVSELVEDPFTLRYQPVPSLYIGDDVVRLKLESFPLPPPDDCEYTKDTKGFRLLIASDQKPDDTRVAYEDKSVPESRRCPIAYALGGVVTPQVGSKGPHMIMVQTASPGFEGSDIRWIAIPIKP